MSTKVEFQFQSSLLSTGLVQPISTKSKPGYLSVLCRQVPGQEKEWLRVVGALLEKEEALKSTEDPSYELHVGTQYVRKMGCPLDMAKGVFLSVSAKTNKKLEVFVGELHKVLSEFRAVLTQDTPREPPPTSMAVLRKKVEYEVATDPEVVAARIQAHTTATPRVPEEVPPDPEVPPEFRAPSLKVTRNETTDGGVNIIEQEMPLPHIYHELNRPDPITGKGAWRPGEFERGFLSKRKRG